MPTNNIKILLSREQSSMASTWEEHFGFEKIDENTFRIGTFGYNWLSLEVIPEDERYDENDEIIIPEEIDGHKINGLVDGEFLETDELITRDDLKFTSEEIKKGLNFCVSHGWEKHPNFDYAWLQIERTVVKLKNQNSRNNHLKILEGSSNFLTINSFIGSEIGDPTSESAEKAPRSAKHVVTISWSWSPMHSRTSEYRISTDKNRAGWHLYEITEGDVNDKKLCSRVSSGYPYKGVTVNRAAYLLLKEAWESEVEQWEFDPSGFEVDKSGLLTNKEILEISEAISWSSQVSWFREQSPESLDLLKEQLQEPIDDQLIEFFDEIESSANDLDLSQDFLELCEHYELERPSLLTLASLIVRDATVVREQKLKRAQDYVERFRKEIDLLISALDDRPRRGGGTNWPSIRSMTKNYLEKYVGEHGKLPSGKHESKGFSNSPFDFDDLRKKYSL